MTAYLVLDLTVHDRRDFLPYVEAIPAFIAKHGGRYLSKGARPVTLEGDWSPQRLVILAFPTRGHAEAFLGTRRRRRCSRGGDARRRAGW
jgi:uncharacterized protein (DUF1330 family)